jgi:hypothetical protein
MTDLTFLGTRLQHEGRGIYKVVRGSNGIWLRPSSDWGFVADFSVAEGSDRGAVLVSRCGPQPQDALDRLAEVLMDVCRFVGTPPPKPEQGEIWWSRLTTQS